MALATPFAIEISGDDDATLVVSAAGSNKLFTVDAASGESARKGNGRRGAARYRPGIKWCRTAVDEPGCSAQAANTVSLVDVSDAASPRCHRHHYPGRSHASRRQAWDALLSIMPTHPPPVLSPVRVVTRMGAQISWSGYWIHRYAVYRAATRFRRVSPCRFEVCVTRPPITGTVSPETPMVASIPQVSIGRFCPIAAGRT